MAMVAAKCTGCGAALTIDSQKDAGICPYCQSAFITEKAISNNITNNSATTNANNIIYNNYYGHQPAQPSHRPFMPPPPQPQVVYHRPVPPRPRANGVLVVLGLIFYIIPGILYLVYINKKQRDWDAKFGH